MPTYAVGSKTGLSYVAETTFGVTPTTPSMKAMRTKFGARLDLKRDTFASQEISTTRQTMDLTYGTRSGSGSIPFEFSYGAFDDFLEAVMGGTWTANVLKVGTVNRSFTIEDQTPEINVYEQNQGCVLNGFSLSVKPNAIVEGSFDLLFKDRRVAATPSTVSIAFDSTAKTLTRTVGSWLLDGFKVGDTPIVRGAADAGNNVSTFPITALTATVMTLGAATGMVTKTTATGATVTLGSLGTAAAAPTNPVFDSFTGTILEGGTVIGYVTGLDIRFEAAAQPNFALFDATAQSVTMGKINVTGTMNVYFVDESLAQKFINGTSSSIQFTLGNGSAKSYTFNMGTVKYTSNSRDKQENAITESIGFTAIYDATDTSTLKITRIP